MSPPARPPFSDLPLDKEGPAGNAWGLYGPDDELGALNMLTPSVIKDAAQEIQTGERVSLDWHLNLPSFPSFKRPPFSWRMLNKAPRTVNDDFIDINTQSSSQWDGFRHYGYQKAKRFYGGRSQADIEASNVIGIDRVAHAGGITTRGVILDYPRYLQRKGRAAVDALSASSVSADELKDMLKETGVQTRPGDLLLLRTGFTAAYSELNAQERKDLSTKSETYLGVESSKDVLEWIWTSGFAAVAGDAPSFEMSPLVGKHNEPGGIWKVESWEEEMQGGGLLHQWLLGGWGVMIGEMWDLERLCERAGELGRWTCFVSSVPLKVSGCDERFGQCGRLTCCCVGTGWCCESAECGGDILIGLG
jgi:kynurenine formamidase